MKSRYPLLAASLVAGGMGFGAPAAIGQQVIEEVVVTGSYIRRAPEDAPSPVRVLGREELEAKGRPQLADLVMTLPAVIGSENVTAQEQSVGGAGAGNINIRNMGLASTLVLLEGKRLNSGTSTSNVGEQFVDINRLPFIMIENIEILKDGASALYGSDAVAGVANFKLRTRFEGFEIQGLYQDTFKGRDTNFDSYGLPEIYREPLRAVGKDETRDTDIGAIWGFGNDRTHFVIGMNYFERDPLETAARDYAVEDIVDGASGGPSPFNLPQDQFAALSVGSPFGTLGPFPTLAYVQDPACNALGYYRTRNSGLCSTKTDLLSRDMFSRERRKQALASWTHDLSDSVEAYGYFGLSENFVEINQSPSLPITAQSRYSAANPGLRHHVYNGIATFLATGGTATPYDDDIANRLIPAGLPVVPLATEAQLSAAFGFPVTLPNFLDPVAVLDALGPVTFNGVVRPSIVNLMNNMGVPADVNGDGVVSAGEIFKDRASSQIERETRLFMAGARGDLTDSWQFDASFSFSKEEGVTTFYDTVNERLADALNGYMGPNCNRGTFENPTTPGDISQGCYWFNPFGSSILEPNTVIEDGYGNEHTLGNDAFYVSQLFGQGIARGTSELTVIDAVVSTNDFMGWTLPGGNVGLAVGAQYRKEKRSTGGNELATDPTFPFAFTGPTIPYSADQDIYALFTELALPATDRLEVQVALRYEDYGGDTGSTLDPKVAARWQAHEDWVLRASWGTSFRGPSIAQKFGRGTGLQFISAPSAAVIAEYFPGGASFGSGVFGRIPTYGNPGLKPEESVNYNFGAIWTPTDNFSASLDYFIYQYKNIIIPESASAMANDCQINWGLAGRPSPQLPDGSVNPAYLAIEACNFRNLDGNPATADILLDSQGNALTVNRSYTNGTRMWSSGLDLLTRYSMDTEWGAFSATLDLTWFLEYDIRQSITPFDTRLNPGAKIDLVGLNYTVLIGRPLPEFKSTLLLDWARNQHYAAVSTNFVSDVTEPEAVPEPLRVSSHTTVDASYTYMFTERNASVTLGAVNLFDREPPKATGFNSFSSTLHDPRGRLWYVRARYGF
ncbi:MAG: TonB-dependent receptor [Pseudomonadales bacterium]|nr:TonB-dependent receptor [Pseudomonadales bacterium]